MEINNHITFGEMFRDTAKKYPQRIAICNEEIAYTYQELDICTGEIAAHLHAAFVRKGSRVGIYGHNSLDVIACYCAVVRMGAVAVMLGANLSASEFLKRTKAARINALLYGMQLPDLPDGWDGNLLFTAPYDGASAFKPGKTSVGSTESLKAVSSEDIESILFTSGTTGSTRGVVISHFSRCNNARAQAEALHATCDDVYCAMLPLYHCFSLAANLAAAFSVGACVCLTTSHHTLDVLHAIERRKCTILQSVPSFFSALLNREDLDEFSLSSLRTAMMAGSAYTPQLYQEVSKRLGVCMRASLGQTETSSGFTFDHGDEPMDIACRSVGRFMEHVEGKIVDLQTGQCCAPGESGEILVRGYNVMLGYCREDGSIEDMRDADGWLRTGDVAYQDEEGRLYLVGRRKEIIVRGGEKIAPREIEEVLEKSSHITACKVIGVPDKHYVEECCACVVLQGAEELCSNDIRELAQKELSAHKIPRYVLFFDEFPLTPSGKISISELRKQALKKLGID